MRPAHGKVSTARRKKAGWQRVIENFYFALVLCLFAACGATWFAFTQPVHPDAYRDTGWNAFLSVDTWLYPIEQNAFKRNVIGGNLNAVFTLPNTNKVWAAGQGGLIVHSEDGGLTWHQQAPRLTASPAIAQWPQFISSAYAGEVPSPKPNEYGYLDQPTYAGQAQQQYPEQKSAAPEPEVNQIQNKQIPKVIRKTANLPSKSKVPSASQTTAVSAGQSKQATSPAQGNAPPTTKKPAEINLMDIAFANEKQGWAIGTNGTILVTQDGGGTWQVQKSGTTADLKRVVVLADGLHAWAGGEKALLRTSDRGTTWEFFLRDNITGLWVSKDGERVRASSYEADFAVQTNNLIQNGSVLAIDDAGKKQVSWQSPLRVALLDFTLAADGERGWGISFTGIVTTQNSGESWRTVKTLEKTQLLSAINFSSDNLHGWVVGNTTDTGLIYRTADGGQSWRTAFIKSIHLKDVAFQDHLRGWVVGDDGHIYTSYDGGSSWQQQTSGVKELQQRATWRNSAAYIRHAAPWYWMVMIALTIVLMWRARASSRVQSTETEDVEAIGAARIFVSDNPLASIAQDRLGHADRVKALCDFIRNRNTDPRLTIAVTGSWGSGKSSVMRMLQAELQQVGFRTTWFNAWHHQQEGRHLTALFNAVREQAMPSNWLVGWWLRSQLIWKRGGAYRLTAILILVLGVAALGDLWASDHPWQRIRAAVTDNLLGWHRVALTPQSVETLSTMVEPTVSTTSSSAEPQTKSPRLRPDVFSFVTNALVWDVSSPGLRCGDTRSEIDPDERCIFNRPQQLLKSVEKGVGHRLYPSEEKAILEAAETLGAEPLFPGMAAILLPLMPVLALFFGKGFSVYGLEIGAQLRRIFSSATGGEPGREESGTIERYRREFGLLTEILQGRLVIFIDDLDRCNPATVASMLELVNYLVDVGECFLVLGIAMEHVQGCIRPHGDEAVPGEYAKNYLKKLIHIEVPIPPLGLDNTRKLLEGLVPNKDEEPASALSEKFSMAENFVSQQRPKFSWHISAAAALAIFLLVAAFFGGRVLNQRLQVVPIQVMAQPVRLPALLENDGSSSNNQHASSVQTTQNRKADLNDSDLTTIGVASTNKDNNLNWGAALFVIFLASLLAYRFRANWMKQAQLALGKVLRTDDSVAFRQALLAWQECIRSRDPNPRGIKRFINRARLLSMWAHAEARHTKKQMSAEVDAGLVALSALHYVAPENLDALEHAQQSGTPVDAQTLASILKNASACFEAHLKIYGSLPSHEQIQQFRAMVEGIYVR